MVSQIKRMPKLIVPKFKLTVENGVIYTALPKGNMPVRLQKDSYLSMMLLSWMIQLRKPLT